MSVPIKITPLGIPQSNHMPLTFIANEANSTVTLTKTGNPNVEYLKYRTSNSDNWYNYQIDQVITLQNIGDYVQFQNNTNTLSIDGFNYVQFIMTGEIISKGNIQSMLNYSKSCTRYCFFKLFSYCDSLMTSPILSATTLNVYCYMRMFEYCTNLTNPPELPAQQLAARCYSYMFYNCTNLIRTPILHAIVLSANCYEYMFYNCQNLTTASQLPATILNGSCYRYMFYGCSSLLVAPTLNASILALECYNCMFFNCSSLTQPPQLPATTLAEKCYRYMFSGCSNLKKAPNLPATSLQKNCYTGMFRFCQSIDHINVNFTEWLSDCTAYWVQGVSSTGTFTCPANLTIPSNDIHGVPLNWSIVRK